MVDQIAITRTVTVAAGVFAPGHLGELTQFMNSEESVGVCRRCGCTDLATGRRLGGRCPRLSDPAHGSWYFSVQLPSETPGPTRFRQGGFRTARQAVAARDQVLASAAAGTSPRRITVEQWLCRWLETLPGRVRRSTAAGYGIDVHRYLIPYLGHYALAGLRPAHVEAMFTAIGAQPTRSGTPISAATLHRVRATLRSSPTTTRCTHCGGWPRCAARAAVSCARCAGPTSIWPRAR